MERTTMVETEEGAVVDATLTTIEDDDGAVEAFDDEVAALEVGTVTEDDGADVEAFVARTLVDAFVTEDDDDDEEACVEVELAVSFTTSATEVLEIETLVVGMVTRRSQTSLTTPRSSRRPAWTSSSMPWSTLWTPASSKMTRLSRPWIRWWSSRPYWW